MVTDNGNYILLYVQPTPARMLTAITNGLSIFSTPKFLMSIVFPIANNCMVLIVERY